jgi:hypothetical protein
MSRSRPAPTRAAAGPLGGAAERALLIGVAFSALVTFLIWGLGPRLDVVALLPDIGASWYEWKLPEPTWWTRAVVWTMYLAHQLTLWGLIWWAQTHRPSYGAGLHRVNVLALAANGGFVLLHVLQTHLTYDGLAQDVSIWSSQGAVIVMLVWILLLENPRRGLVFGAKLPMGAELRRFIRRYHGYFFAWAIVYTFWYHPAVSTTGHLWGFFYTMLLLVQSSLFFTRAHLNRYWTFVLEATVLVHGALVAVGQGAGIWPMFAFGFGGLIVMTQMHGLGLSRWARAGVVAVYAALVTWVYAGRGWGNLNEIVRIPVIEILAALLLAGIFALAFQVARRIGPATSRSLPRFLVGSTIGFAALVAVFWLSDSPIVAFVALAVGAPILAAGAWRSLAPVVGPPAREAGASGD